MQNQENFFKKQTNRAKIKRENMMSSIHKKLTEKSVAEVGERARGMAGGLVIFLLSWVLSGGLMPLNTYPLAIALICGVSKYYFAAALGATLGGIIYEIGWEYIFAYVFGHGQHHA